jgi:hypothetical protein
VEYPKAMYKEGGTDVKVDGVFYSYQAVKDDGGEAAARAAGWFCSPYKATVSEHTDGDNPPTVEVVERPARPNRGSKK